jgi:hypothetical protein
MNEGFANLYMSQFISKILTNDIKLKTNVNTIREDEKIIFSQLNSMINKEISNSKFTRNISSNAFRNYSTFK